MNRPVNYERALWEMKYRICTYLNTRALNG